MGTWTLHTTLRKDKTKTGLRPGGTYVLYCIIEVRQSSKCGEGCDRIAGDAADVKLGV